MDEKDYKELINNLNKNNGVTDIVFRKKWLKFIKHFSYDNSISKWLEES